MSFGGLNISMVGRAIMTSISTYAMKAFVWATLNMSLITAFSYYAMWTFIISSLWVGLEDAGAVPTATVQVYKLGNLRVAKGIQVLSGLSFFFGLIVMGGIPDMKQSPMAQQVQTRSAELRKELGKSHGYGSTIAVGVARNKAGEQITLVSTNDTWKNKSINLKPNELFIYGPRMHAEKRMVDFCKEQNLDILMIGASRPVCTEICEPAIGSTGADIVTPIKGEHLIGN
jgi:hypothetical protein